MILHTGDCEEVLAQYPDNYFDCVVTDPPYGLGEVKDIQGLLHAWMNDLDADKHVGKGGFMNAKWDKIVPSPRKWKAILRVLKPGGHLLAFAGTRTHDLMGISIRLAGFEDRDSIDNIVPSIITWVHSQGFPKSLDVSKAIDKMAGAEREVVRTERHRDLTRNGRKGDMLIAGHAESSDVAYTAPATDDAKRWLGFGSAVKPAHEPVLVFRKPLAEKNIAANVLKWGTGALNIDATRIPTGENLGRDNPNGPYRSNRTWNTSNTPGHYYIEPDGRYPTNLTLSHVPTYAYCGSCGEVAFEPDEQCSACGSELIMVQGCGDTCVPGCPVKTIDGQSNYSKTKRNEKPSDCGGNTWGGTIQVKRGARGYTDSGCASRFFPVMDADPFLYQAKPSRKERDAGLEESEDVVMNRVNPGGIEHDPRWAPIVVKNNHPTVKSIRLMRWLVSLVTPPDGKVLDPFCGSGSTGCGVALLNAEGNNFEFYGIDMDEHNTEIARQRIAHWSKQSEQMKKKSGNWQQLPLFDDAA